MIVHIVPGSNTKPSEENIGMFETAVMVAVVHVLCNSLLSEERNIYLLLITRHTYTHPKLDPKFTLACTVQLINIGRTQYLFIINNPTYKYTSEIMS